MTTCLLADHAVVAVAQRGPTPAWRLCVRAIDLSYASKKHWSQIARDLRPIYTAPSEAEAYNRFAEFSGTWERRYPAIIRLWENAWAEFGPVPGVRCRDPQGHRHDQRHRVGQRSAAPRGQRSSASVLELWAQTNDWTHFGVGLRSVAELFARVDADEAAAVLLGAVLDGEVGGIDADGPLRSS